MYIYHVYFGTMCDKGRRELYASNFTLFIARMFLQTTYHQNYAHCDMQFMTYINSYMFRHLDVILRESLQQR